MITIKFYFRSDRKDKTRGYIWVSFYVNRQKVNFSTKVFCDLKHWNIKTMSIMAADKDAADKNLVIENIRARISNVFVKYRLRERKLTREIFLKAYHKPDDYEHFFEFCDYYMKKVSQYNADGTMNNHRKALKKLKDFNPTLHFDDITGDFLKQYFLGHLTRKVSESKKKTQGLGNMQSTAYKDMAIIKRYVFAAMREGYIEINPFEDFKIKRSAGSFTYLTEDELPVLIKFYKSGDMELPAYKTLQLFLYMCFSSQHVGDALLMQAQAFEGDTFVYVRQKLRNSKPEPIYVPISESLKSIVKDILGHRKKGPLFEDMPTEQAMNRMLKQICSNEAVKIDKPISHKTGRHTFATLYYSKTKDLYGLKEIMGHSDIRETLKYVHILERDQRKNISVFDLFMSDPGTDE